VVAHFVEPGSSAAGTLAEWRSDPHKRDVVPFVEQSRTTTLYRCRREDVVAVCRETEHALGDVKRSTAESVGSIADWHPRFAFEHVLNLAEERLGEVPTFQRFREFCLEDRDARAMLTEPAKEAVRRAVALGAAPVDASDAMRWRVGNAYLGHLKQAYVIAVLREAGFDVRYHVLADVLFRVDFWIDRTCFALFVGNPRFRSGAEGRKTPASLVIGRNSFRHASIELPVRHEFGEVHLPDAGHVVDEVWSVLED